MFCFVRFFLFCFVLVILFVVCGEGELLFLVDVCLFDGVCYCGELVDGCLEG